jgi:glutamate/tyrosine decarboxylase-like PLP-dependent enzyme
MSLKTFGAEAFRQAIDRGVDLAEAAEKLIVSAPDLELITPPQLGVVTFRYRPAGSSGPDIDELNRTLVSEIIASEQAMLSTTDLKGQTVLRLCTINPRTTDADLEAVIQLVRDLGADQVRAHQDGGNAS